MKLRTLAVLAALVLTPALARAQTGGTSGGGSTSGGGGKTVRMTQALLDKLIPLLQEEAGATNAFWWDQRSARGMTKQEYTAAKNTLFIAKLDAASEGRITALPSNDGSRATRQGNITVYRTNKVRIDAALARVHADGCGPACSASSPPPARTNR